MLLVSQVCVKRNVCILGRPCDWCLAPISTRMTASTCSTIAQERNALKATFVPWEPFHNNDNNNNNNSNSNSNSNNNNNTNSNNNNNNQQSTINNQQSTINNQQSTINNQQSTINNQQSTINNQQSTINHNRQTRFFSENMFHNQSLLPGPLVEGLS